MSNSRLMGKLPMETSHRDDDETDDLAHDLMRHLMRRLGPAVSPRAFRLLIAANS
jgi:pyruvate-formate lyase